MNKESAIAALEHLKTIINLHHGGQMLLEDDTFSRMDFLREIDDLGHVIAFLHQNVSEN